MIALYHAWDSLQSFKVRLCLAELGVNWEDRAIRLTDFDHLKPDYLRVNPDGLVPALVDEGATLVESTVILTFLDEKYGKSRLHPLGPMGRARMRWWCYHEDTVVHQAIRPLTFNLYIKPILAELSPKDLELKIAAHPLPERADAYRSAIAAPFDRSAVVAAIQCLNQTIARVDHNLQEGTWLVGDQFSLADIALAALIDRLETLGLSRLWERYPHAQGWARRVESRPSFPIALGQVTSEAASSIDRALLDTLCADAGV